MHCLSTRQVVNDDGLSETTTLRVDKIIYTSYCDFFFKYDKSISNHYDLSSILILKKCNLYSTTP